MSRTLALSGTRNLNNPEEQLQALRFLNSFPLFQRYITGGALGFDTEGGRWLQKYKQAQHRVYILDSHARKGGWWSTFPNVEVVVLPLGSTMRDRNIALVDNSDFLAYCSMFSELNPLSIRSGTWQTVRLARRAGLPMEGIILRP